MKENNSKRIYWIIGILVGIFMAVSGYSILGLDNLRNSVSREYVSQKEYSKDYKNISDRLDRMENKIDNIYEYLTDGPRKPKR